MTGCFASKAEQPRSPESQVCPSPGVPAGSLDTSLPLVYAAALEGIETHGWSAVYPADDPPAWTILHWAAMEGDRLDLRCWEHIYYSRFILLDHIGTVSMSHEHA